MRRICTVLARAGSVGVPGKNTRLLGGVPLRLQAPQLLLHLVAAARWLRRLLLALARTLGLGATPPATGLPASSAAAAAAAAAGAAAAAVGGGGLPLLLLVWLLVLLLLQGRPLAGQLLAGPPLQGAQHAAGDQRVR